jgi:iron complex transport system ATP-binding protein
MEYYFTAQKLAVGYDNRPLIENIDFSLKRGEILTLIGPNGAGKSTILKSIARQLSLVSGTIYLDKSDVVTMNGNEFAKKMAVVLTDKLKTELMTCYDVVATGRYPYTGRFGVLSDEDKKAVDEAMELVNVSQIKDKDFTKISDGQRQRVMLSRAICQQPEIIVLDEPTSYLDIKYKLEFLSILQRLKRQKNLTVIMSLHELDMAKRVSDHILCIDGRYVDRYGTPEEVFTDQYVSGLFGITAGSFDETGEDLELEKPDGRARIFVIAGGGLGRKSPETYWSVNTSSGVPYLSTYLPSIHKIWSDTRFAISSSWSDMITVRFFCLLSLWSIDKNSSLYFISRYEVGSSNTIISGCWHIARDSITRCL